METKKRVWITPELTKFGSVRDLTRSDPKLKVPGTPDDFEDPINVTTP